MHAPYAAQAVGDNEYYRQFFVFENGSAEHGNRRETHGQKGGRGIEPF